MIKAKPGLTPIYVRYYDNQAASIYNLSEDQYNNLINSSEQGIDVADNFEVEQLGDIGYAPAEIVTLAKIYGFEVDSE